MEKKTYIKEWIKIKNTTIANTAKRMGITAPALSLQLARPSFSSLCNISAALNVEPWQLLAPPSVVEELKQARAARDGVGGCALVGVVRVGNEIYTADNVQQLRALVERLERAESGTDK